MTEPVLMNPWIPVVSAFGASFITGLISFFINLSNKKSAERRHQSSLIMNTAIENWKQQLDVARTLFEANPKKMIETPPLDICIIHMMKLNEILTNKKLSSQNLKNEILEMDQFMKPVYKAYRKIDEEVLH